MYKTILFEIQDGIATITINRPEVMNSLNDEMYGELVNIFNQCGEREDVRCVIVTGEGRAFCAGGDIGTMMGDDGAEVKNPLGTKEGLIKIGKMSVAARKCPKPIIAMINGAVAGAGFSLAAACDFRIISSKAVFTPAFIKIAASGDTGIILNLARLVGFNKMEEIMMLGNKISAEEAELLGLATKVVVAQDLLKETYTFAKRLAVGPTFAYGQQKKVFWETFFEDIYPKYENSEAESMLACGASEDFVEATTAFIEKRKPYFTGK